MKYVKKILSDFKWGIIIFTFVFYYSSCTVRVNDKVFKKEDNTFSFSIKEREGSQYLDRELQ